MCDISNWEHLPPRLRQHDRCMFLHSNILTTVNHPQKNIFISHSQMNDYTPLKTLSGIHVHGLGGQSVWIRKDAGADPDSRQQTDLMLPCTHSLWRRVSERGGC